VICNDYFSMRELTRLARRGGQPVGALKQSRKAQRLDGDRAWARLADCERGSLAGGLLVSKNTALGGAVFAS
jgi:hypothetical protein